MKNLSPYSKYKKDFFYKLNYKFQKNLKILDIGCGDGGDARIFITKYKLETFGIDIFQHREIKKINNLTFKIGGIYDIPFKSGVFDYVYLHDVLRHIDEKSQSFIEHKKALRELKRVCRNNGVIVIVEANRYNPLFYPHMVLINRHNHFTQEYFNKLIKSVFKHFTMRNFESHVYPSKFNIIWKFYEMFMEKISPRQFRAYNVAIIKNIR